MRIHGEGIHAEWRQTRRQDIYRVETYTERGYKTFTEKRHTWSGDIHGENIHKVGTD